MIRIINDTNFCFTEIPLIREFRFRLVIYNLVEGRFPPCPQNRAMKPIPEGPVLTLPTWTIRRVQA